MYNIKLPSYRKKGEYGFMEKILVKRFNYALSIYKKRISRPISRVLYLRNYIK